MAFLCGKVDHVFFVVMIDVLMLMLTYVCFWLSIVVLAKPGNSRRRIAYASQGLNFLLTSACAVMLPFAALHYVALLWFSVIFRRGCRQFARRSRPLGIRSLKRMSRCSPMLIQRWLTREFQCDAIVATSLRLVGACASSLLQAIRGVVCVHLSWLCSTIVFQFYNLIL